MRECPISDELRSRVLHEIREAFLRESSGLSSADRYAIDFEKYAEDVFRSLWGSVTSLYYDYLSDLRRGRFVKKELDQSYQEGIESILAIGGVSPLVAGEVAEAHTKNR